MQTLCKIASAPIPDEAGSLSREVKSNMLALTMLETAFRAAGDCKHLSKSAAFNSDMMKRVVPVLAATCVHHLPGIFKETTETVLEVFLTFRQVMHRNIGNLFSLCYLPLGRSDTAGFLHKQTILHLFKRILQNHEVLVEL